MFSHLFTQYAVLKITNGTDCCGIPIIKETLKISCRVEFKNTMVIGQTGREITSSGRLFTDTDVKTGDIIVIENKEFTVEQAFRSVDLSGEYCLNEVYFK